jgi:general secretion pathway protein M
MDAIRQLINSLQSSFATLSSREKKMIAGASAAAILFVLFLVTFGFSNSANSIRSRTAGKVTRLQEVQDLAATYREARASQDAMEQRLAQSNVRLISYLEEKGNKAGLSIPSINPKADVTLEGDKIIESAAEFTLNDVALNRLVDFLAAVEAGPGIVRVKYLRLEPRLKDETLTAWVIVATYHLKN